MAISTTFRGWDRWALNSADVRLPITLWHIDASQIADASGGTISLLFELPQTAFLTGNLLTGRGAWGLIDVNFGITGLQQPRTVALQINGFSVLPGYITHGRTWSFLCGTDNQNRSYIRGADRLHKLWLGHRLVEAVNTIIAVVENNNGETFVASVFLAEWTAECWRAGGPRWPDLV